jgi:hypothetical protein
MSPSGPIPPFGLIGPNVSFAAMGAWPPLQLWRGKAKHVASRLLDVDDLGERILTTGQGRSDSSRVGLNRSNCQLLIYINAASCCRLAPPDQPEGNGTGTWCRSASASCSNCKMRARTASNVSSAASTAFLDLSSFRVDQGRLACSQLHREFTRRTANCDPAQESFGLLLIDGMCLREEAVMSAILPERHDADARTPFDAQVLGYRPS